MLDKAVQALVALGIPGLILTVVIGTTGLAGGAATVTALAALGGPFGILGGIAAFGVMVLASSAITKYGLDEIAKAVVRGLRNKGYSKRQIRDQIDGVPSIVLSRTMKEKCKSYV